MAVDSAYDDILAVSALCTTIQDLAVSHLPVPLGDNNEGYVCGIIHVHFFGDQNW